MRCATADRVEQRAQPCIMKAELPRLNQIRRALLLAYASLTLSCCAGLDAQDRRRGEPAAEFRAAWIATVNNIDWPSRKGLSSVNLRRELDAIVARSVELRLNALIFQARAAGDAFYRSRLEPWSEWLTGTQGQAPDGAFDPLRYLIDRCHRSGIQLHAWFNPFRSWHKSGRSKPHASHVSQREPCTPHRLRARYESR